MNCSALERPSGYGASKTKRCLPGTWSYQSSCAWRAGSHLAPAVCACACAGTAAAPAAAPPIRLTPNFEKNDRRARMREESCVGMRRMVHEIVEVRSAQAVTELEGRSGTRLHTP